MRDRLIELLWCANMDYNEYEDDMHENGLPCDSWDEYIADCLLEGGMIVPPCKVGDTLYIHWREIGRKKIVRPVKAYALRWDEKKHNFRVCVEGTHEVTAFGGSYTDYYRATFNWDKFGKTIFRTKKAAEMALERKD